MEHLTFYRTIQIDELSIFYREAGPKDAPTLLLLHELPSSSRMFEPLFARLVVENGTLVGILSRDAIVHYLEVRRSLGVENAKSDTHNKLSRAA